MKGLRLCGQSPQEYNLSDILYTFNKVGVKNITEATIKISVKDDSITDGSWDVSVPVRIPEECKILRNLKLAWKVFTGKADILYYK